MTGKGIKKDFLVCREHSVKREVFSRGFVQCVNMLFALFSRSVMSDSLRPRGLQASLLFTISQSLLILMSIQLMMPSNHLPLSSPSPPDLNLSQHPGIFQ